MSEANYKYFIPHHFCFPNGKSGGGCKLFFSRTYEQRELVVLNPCEMAALRPLREAKDFTGLKIS